MKVFKIPFYTEEEKTKGASRTVISTIKKATKILEQKADLVVSMATSKNRKTDVSYAGYVVNADFNEMKLEVAIHNEFAERAKNCVALINYDASAARKFDGYTLMPKTKISEILVRMSKERTTKKKGA